MRGDAALRFVVGCMALNSLLAAPFIALIPAVALDVFHDEKFGTAALVTAQGVGAVCMGLALADAVRPLRDAPGPARRAVHAAGRARARTRSRPTLPLAVVAIFFVGVLYLGSLSSFTTVAQLRAPAALRGRVVSVLMMLIGALYPIGSVVQGAIADEIGLRATTAGAAVLLAAPAARSGALLRPRGRRRSASGDTDHRRRRRGGPDAVVSTGLSSVTRAPGTSSLRAPTEPRCDRGSNCS